MSTLIRSGQVSAKPPKVFGEGIYGSWGTKVTAGTGETVQLQYARAVNKRPRDVIIYARWLDASNSNNPLALEGPVTIAEGDYYDFALGLVLEAGDQFQMRAEESDSCDATVVWDVR